MNEFFGKKIFVTGATGLVGSWLTKSLIEKGAEPVCLVRDRVANSMFFSDGYCNKVTVVNGELTDFLCLERIVNEYEPEYVIHLGAQTIVGTANASPIGTFESNIRGTWLLLEACRLHDDKVKSIVVASSDKAYGQQEKLPYKEDAPLKGSNMYDVSKSCADLVAQAYGKTYGMPLSISRCGNFFGGGDLNFSRIVPGTIKSAYFNQSPVIRSSGQYVRDYIYVKDAVSAYETLAQKTKELKFHGEAFNFSNEMRLTVVQLVSRVLELMGKKELKPVIKNEARGEITEQHLSASKARKVLGWKSEWQIDAGLKETIEWYTTYFDTKKRCVE